jgi:hypothetical protein
MPRRRAAAQPQCRAQAGQRRRLRRQLEQRGIVVRSASSRSLARRPRSPTRTSRAWRASSSAPGPPPPSRSCALSASSRAERRIRGQTPIRLPGRGRLALSLGSGWRRVLRPPDQPAPNRTIARTSTRASASSWSTATHSSTAWARSIPVRTEPRSRRRASTEAAATPPRPRAMAATRKTVTRRAPAECNEDATFLRPAIQEGRA